ncbi:hypothetical protein SUGI_0001960 [Cryptomeria japonica]|nr:hypothetical protein SUGI_0001960 [Cryptomeria japonica]
MGNTFKLSQPCNVKLISIINLKISSGSSFKPEHLEDNNTLLSRKAAPQPCKEDEITDYSHKLIFVRYGKFSVPSGRPMRMEKCDKFSD